MDNTLVLTDHELSTITGSGAVKSCALQIIGGGIMGGASLTPFGVAFGAAMGAATCGTMTVK